jgi:hypothetical protein
MDKKKKLNKEYKYNEINGNFNIKIGTSDRLNPAVIYLEANAWVEPMEDYDYAEMYNNILPFFKKLLKKYVNEYNNLFSDKFIFDIDFPFTNLKYKRKKYLSFSVFFKQRKCNMNLKEITDLISQTISPYIEQISDYFVMNDFSMRRKKSEIPTA